jgi:hypothetical protein
VSGRDIVERPALGWWIAVVGGLALTGLLGFHDGAYALFAEHVTAVLPQRLLAVVFVVSYAIHLGEALYARALARRAGLHASATAWAVQTFLLGFPSLRLLRARTAGR